MKPTNLREALDQISDMLSGNDYSQDLWNVLVALRGPDSRKVWVKNATTAVIRLAAFPEMPTETASVYRDDSTKYAAFRQEIFRAKCDTNHFREHVKDAFTALGLKLYEENKRLWLGGNPK